MSHKRITLVKREEMKIYRYWEKRDIHVNRVPLKGTVICPICKTSVGLDEKRCSNCNQYIDYNNNIKTLLNWSLDLSRVQIEEVKNGLIFYEVHSKSSTYRNVYSIVDGKNIIPEAYTKYYISISYQGDFFIIHDIYRKSSFGILDMKGNVILEPVYDEIDYIDECLNFVVSYEGKVGVNNISIGNRIPMIYNSIERVWGREMLYVARGSSGKFGLIDIDHQVVAPFVFDAISYTGYGEGLIPVMKEGKWGYYDIEKRNIRIPFKYDKVNGFINSAAKVVLGEHTLFIDKNGSPALPDRMMVEDGKVVWKDFSGNILQKPLFDSKRLESKILPFKVGDMYGAVTSSGDFVIPPIYQEVGFEHDDLVVVKKDNLYGVLSMDGKVIIPFIYADASICDGLIKVMGRKDLTDQFYVCVFGLLNKFGEFIAPLEYENFLDFDRGLIFYEKPGNCSGVMDRFGNYVEYTL